MAERGWGTGLKRWLFDPPEPPLVCEIASDYVVAARQRRGRLEAWASRPLPEGLVRPAPTAENITDRLTLQQALEYVLGAVGDGQRDCALLLPDPAGRVVLLGFDSLSDKPVEAEALIRWRLSKDLPFDLNQAALSYSVQRDREVVVAVSLRSVLQQYEDCLAAAGGRPGCVTFSSLGALGWLAGDGAGPRLFVRQDRQALSVAIAASGALRLFRSLPTPAASSADAAAQFFEKIYPALVYHQDRWGESVATAYLAGLGALAGPLAERLRREASCEAGPLPLEQMDIPPAATSGAAADDSLAAVLGWIRAGAP